MSDTLIRRAIAQDAAAIAAVRMESWRVTYRGIMPDAYLASMNLDESTAIWSRILSMQSDNATVFVVERTGRDGEIIGFAAGKALEEPKFGLNAELVAIHLRPDAQRMGFGRRLVDVITEAHQSHGATGLLVWVIAANTAARRFYEKLGAELLVERPFTWDE
ncbi:MAG TPA: GNAT family N-acetyltransferase, partial [Burkholderiaceae bacterium]|nr:GNAT family N-acetyltransferase [Burkholderiaceae bacterium]